jgi:hypothetical protein
VLDICHSSFGLRLSTQGANMRNRKFALAKKMGFFVSLFWLFFCFVGGIYLKQMAGRAQLRVWLAFSAACFCLAGEISTSRPFLIDSQVGDIQV